MKYKISFCTVAMNRRKHIEKTLLSNIIDNCSYINNEFILLDYNSMDNLENYIHDHLKEYIDSGKLKYFKTLRPQFFNRAHSRNVAFKLASGDIICNVDADNFTGMNFSDYINNEFLAKNRIFLSNTGYVNQQDILGRICVKREDFLKIGGFDERFVNYGFEDYDFCNRLKISGLTQNPFDITKPFFKVLAHAKTDRLSNEYGSKNLDTILLRHLTPSSSEIILLYKTLEFQRYIYIDNQTHYYGNDISEVTKLELEYQYTIEDNIFCRGSWNILNNKYVLTINEKPFLRLRRNSTSFESDQADIYQIIDNPVLITEIIMLASAIPNRKIMNENIASGKFNVNGNSYGSEVVYKNFQSNAIKL